MKNELRRGQIAVNKRSLIDHCNIVLKALNEMDEIMKEKESINRGRAIAEVCNRIQFSLHVIKRYGLNQSLPISNVEDKKKCPKCGDLLFIDCDCLTPKPINVDEAVEMYKGWVIDLNNAISALFTNNFDDTSKGYAKHIQDTYVKEFKEWYASQLNK